MWRDESDHSVGREIFLGEGTPSGNGLEPALGNRADPDTEEDHIRASVWDEPASQFAGLRAPENAATYAAWYRRKKGETSVFDAFAVTILLVLAGGPFALVGTFATGNVGGSSIGILLVVLVAPVVEEMLKAGATLITLERKPYLFKSSLQILFAVAASGLIFSIIENLLYIHVYIEDPTPEIIQWRWTVCTFLHVGCSTIAGLGLIRMFRAADKTDTAPEVRRAYPLLVTAMFLHGTYNASAMVLEFLITPF